MNRSVLSQSPQSRKLHSPLSNRSSSADPSAGAHLSRPRTPTEVTSSPAFLSQSPSNRRRPLTSNEWISSRFESGSPAELSRFVENSLMSDIVAEYCDKIDNLSLELQSCKRQLILQQKKSERALADLAAAGAEELATVHRHYAILLKDFDKKMLDMQAQIDAEQNMKRDWTHAQRKNIQSARSHSEKLAVLQYTCDSALQKAAKFETLYTEQLRISEVQCDRVSTLESENASLSNKVANMQNAATARATSMQRMQNEIQRVQATLKNKLHVDKKKENDDRLQLQDASDSKSPPHMSQFVRSQLGSPTVQISTFPPPPLRSDVAMQDSAGIASGADCTIKLLTNPSTGYELKANLGFQLPAFPPSRPLSSERVRGGGSSPTSVRGASSPSPGRGEVGVAVHALQQLTANTSPRAKTPELLQIPP